MTKEEYDRLINALKADEYRGKLVTEQDYLLTDIAYQLTRSAEAQERIADAMEKHNENFTRQGNGKP